jgi:RNA polymerase sigma factor (sigma-70 family)
MVNQLNKVLDHLHRTLSPTGGDLTDGQLLARFIASRDEWAFAALVRRHGPMVLGVCRRMLRHVQDAEDCFQATFLVLARKASAVPREAVGSWLYSVAYRTSLRARAVNARRRSREKQVEDMPHPEFIADEAKDWRPWLDHELNLLPETYREVIVACDLEGRSRKEAALLLGLAEGTVSSRLARGRCLLAKRLSRYGLALSGGALAASLTEATASAAPASLVSATVKVAVLVAAGEFSAVSSSVAILMKGAFETMLLTKLKLGVGAVMVVMVLGASGQVYRASGQSGTAGKGGSRPATELDVLKQEVELLKLKLELVERKLKAQDEELRALRADAKGGGNKQALSVAEALVETIRNQKASDVETVRDAARKALELRKQKDLEAEQSARKLLLEEAAQNLQSTGYYLRLFDLQSKSDPLQEAEAALKALREARDTEAQRKATDALDKALQKLREQQKKQKGSLK